MGNTARNQNLAVLLERLARRSGWSAKVAYLVGNDEFSYGDVFAGVYATAAVLAAYGVRPGSRVLIALPDGMDFVWTFLATLYLGAVAVPANPGCPRTTSRP